MAHLRGAVLLLTCVALPLTMLGVPRVATAFDPHHTRFAGEPVAMGQTDGPVWALETIGKRLYAGGSFGSTRPSGSSEGQRETGQAFLGAFEGPSGAPVPEFDPALSVYGSTRPPTVFALESSPDRSTLYAGGDFTEVDGQVANRITALDPVTGDPTHPVGAVGVDGRVTALAVSPDGKTLYVGGDFSHSADEPRKRLAAFDVATGALLDWAPVPGNPVKEEPLGVTSLAVSEDGATVFVGGTFRTMNGTSTQGFAAVSSANAGGPAAVRTKYGTDHVASTSWATSIAVDDGDVFFTTRDDLSGRRVRTEGLFSVDVGTGALNWYSKCYGDAFAVLPMANEIYVGSHAHDCSPAGGMPEKFPRIYLGMHVVARATGKVRPHFVQTFGTDALDTRLSSRALALVGGHLVMGGGYTTVNGAEHHNLSRFPRGSARPAEAGWPTPSTCAGCGRVRVRVSEGFDRDDIRLTYRVYRNRNTTRPIKVVTRRSVLWEKDSFSFVDRAPRKGQRVSYRVKATDPSGRSAWSGRSQSVIVGRPSS